MEGQNLGTRKMHRVKDVTIFWLYVCEISDRKIQVKGGGCQLKNKKTFATSYNSHIVFDYLLYSSLWSSFSIENGSFDGVASAAGVSVINGEQRATY